MGRAAARVRADAEGAPAAEAAELAGYVSQSVFRPDQVSLNPNAIYFAFMLVPDPGITGSSRDFASGPVIPNSLFPLANNVDVWLDEVLESVATPA